MKLSLRARLFGLWLMSLFGSLVVAVLIVFLFRQTVAAHRERDRAVAARACEAITAHYDFYTAALDTPPAGPAFDAGLRAVLVLALRREDRVVAGIETADAAAGATSGPAPAGAIYGTVPAGLSATIAEQVNDAIAADRLVLTTKGGFLDRTTIAACPLGGPLDTPVANIAAFTVLQADLLRSNFTRVAFGGLAVLLATMLASAGFLARLVLGFSRRLAGVESALAADEPGALDLTGEAELDRLINALNAANFRLDAARTRMAQSERLAALGRMAAGLAHEIRNPLGAIRLRAETALARSGVAADAGRDTAALDHILVEAARLESLTTRLLGFAATPSARPVPTVVDALIAAAIDGQSRAIGYEPSGIIWTLDPILTRSAIDNLLRNAIQACGDSDTITIAVRVERGLTITVADTGPGIDPRLGDPFEPFMTGRADGVGLGLAIARDLVRAQGGSLVHRDVGRGAVFVIELPEVGGG